MGGRRTVRPKKALQPRLFETSPRFGCSRGERGDVIDEPPHQIHSYTLLFSLFLHFPYIADLPLRTSAPTRPHVIALTQQSHSLYQTDLAYLMDIWLTIHMYLLLFLASPMCPLLRSDQSQGLALHGQALSIALPYARILVYHSYLTCLYLPFTRRTLSPKP